MVREVRKQLDALGATATRIVVTSDLDEYTIAGLGSSPVDAFGVGTSVVTGSGHPAVGLVYKLVARRDRNDAWVAVQKTSTGKSNAGGIKTATRLLTNGVAIAEEITLGEGVASAPGRPLITDHIRAGEPVVDDSAQEALERAREHHRQALSELPTDAMRLGAGEPVIPTVFRDATA